MAFEKFISVDFKPETLAIIRHAQTITDDYKSRGFTLTLRQLYYQFVVRDLLPNEQRQYKKLGRIVDNARQAGMLDWDTIEDRQRNLESPSTWSGPESIMRSVVRSYKEDVWASQKYRPEVWIEKDALTGVIEPVCERYRVPYFACRGYASQSEVYAAGKRFQRYAARGYTPIVFHLGDHDPSGLHMTVDNEDRLSLFAGQSVEVRRLALNMDQIDLYDPPPNPAKETDTRFEGYAAEYGESSWELDALDPDVIDQIVADALETIIDSDPWEKSRETESENLTGLRGTSEHWDRVLLFLKHRTNYLDINDYQDCRDAISDLDDLLDEISGRID